MDPVSSLLLTLLALHIVEGIFWVRRDAVIFARGWRSHRRADTSGPLGNATHTLVVLSPFPPLFELFIVEPWPITFARDGLWTMPAEVFGRARAAGAEPEKIAAEQLEKTRADAKQVLAGERALVTTSSLTSARKLAALISEWAQAKVDRRAAIVRGAIKHRHDAAAVRARLEQFERVTWRLRILGNLVLPGMLGTFYVLFYGEGPNLPWRAVLVTFLALLVIIWIEMFFAHRRLYPELRGDRAMKMALMILSFPAAARARAWLARDLFAEFHPLAVAEVLLPRAELETYAASVWRALKFPVAPRAEEARADVDAALAELGRAQNEQLKSAGVTAASLEVAPVKKDAGAKAYCPRCLLEYSSAEGDCPDCPGVARAAYDLTGPRP